MFLQKKKANQKVSDKLSFSRAVDICGICNDDDLLLFSASER